MTALRSTCVIPLGTHTITSAWERTFPAAALRMKWRSICSVTAKSAITPSRSGRVAEMYDGVRPIIRRASDPTAWTSPVRSSIATTDGSKRTTPSPRRNTTVFAVPRSTASWGRIDHIESFIARRQARRPLASPDRNYVGTSSGRERK